jgi:geranylgeranyl reductase family protein
MASPTLHTQALIVGAGPAGCGTSYFLSKAGIPHVILEKETFPRDKVCGDAVSGKSAYVLRTANAPWLHEIFKRENEFLPSKGIQFVAPNGKGLDVVYPDNLRPGETAPGFTVPRLRLDQFLFEKIDPTYANVQQGVAIKKLEKIGGKNIVTYTQNGEEHTIAADIVVGADGDKGIVRKTYYQHSANQKTYSVGLRAYYKGVTGEHPSKFIELHFLPEVLPGYLWIFPLPDGMFNVGIGMLSDQVRRKKINLREVMLNALKNNPAMRERFAGAELQGKILGWGLPMVTKREPVSGDGYVLTGDAAALIDAFSGEGIGNALYSGMLAAGAIEKAVAAGKNDAAFLKEAYDDVLYRRLGDEIRISATLQRLCNYPWLFNLVVNKAAKSPELRDTISGMFSDLDLRAKLRKPSFYFNILFNR